MNEDIRIFEMIVKFIIEKRGTYDFSLSRETKLENDLEITGDDAPEFIIEFSKRFNVDISDCDLGKYFGVENEGIVPIWPLLRFLFGRRKWIPLPPNERKDLTIDDLVQAALKGKLT